MQEPARLLIYASKAICRGFCCLDFTDRLAAVQVPAVIICGDDDKPLPFEAASKVLSENIPTACAVIINDTGQFPHMKKPETVNEVVWEWLEEKVNRS